MTPTRIPEFNAQFRAPPNLDESQCASVWAYVGQVARGTMDGATICVTAWQPTPEEIEAIRKGAPIFMSAFGGLAPHYLSTDFQTATHPA